MNFIINEDCFIVLPTIADKSVDLVMTDLPYGQTRKAWDVKIDLAAMWKQLKRIGKPTCIYLFFCNTRFGVELINSQPKWYRNDIVWEKNHAVGFLSANKCLMKAHEMIYIFHKYEKKADEKWTYNPQKTEGEAYTCSKPKREDGIYGETKNLFHHENKGDRFPTSVVRFAKPSRPQHSTQKPVDLCEWLIKTYSNEGDVVLDFCMGSGSTIVAAINTKRKYIGIEKSREIYEIAEKRIKDII